MSVYIYFDFEYHRMAVSQVSKSHSCMSVKVDLFRCPAGDRKSPPLNICGKEVDSGEKSIPQTAYLSSEVNKYTAKLSFGSYIAQHFITTGLIINIYRNLHKAVYKKEDFKRRDRWRSFSISLNFYQAILHPSPQTRFMFDIKKLYIITRCANIYSRRNSTGRGELRSINPNSVEGDFHNPLTSRCETLDWQKLLAIL